MRTGLLRPGSGVATEPPGAATDWRPHRAGQPRDVTAGLRRGSTLALVIALLLFAADCRAEYQAGLAAYRAGDYSTALAEWQRVAEQPLGTVEPGLQAESCYALAMLHWLGQGVPQDTAQSAGWLERAAELNHAGAQAKLGYLYLIGQGVPQSHAEAEKWLRIAAHQDSAEAQYNLGVMYRDGIGVPPLPERAVEWFSEAAANGDAVSARIVAHYQRTGELPADDRILELSSTRATTKPPDTASDPIPAESAEVSAEVPNEALAEALAAASADAPVDVAVDAPADSPVPTHEDARWISTRDPAHYTIQVIAVRNTDKVLDFIARHPEWQPFALFRQHSNEEGMWVLVHGDYTDVEQARAARDRFPPGIQARDNLWIRRFEMVQQLLP